VAAYVAGLQAMRDGSGEAATRSLEAAVLLDPALAAAHLRLAFAEIGPKPAEAREHYRQAADLRALLTERDRALFDALEPLVLGQPSDFAGCARRLAEVIGRYPRDAELAFYHAMVLVEDMRAGVAELDRALELDPRFALAWWVKAQRLAYLGEIDAALGALERCLEVSPRANECRENRVWIDQERGECARVEADARAMAAASPDSPAPYHLLAGALAALGRPQEAVREALRQKHERLPGAARREAELGDGVLLGLLMGDFQGAERDARALAELVAPRAAAEDHARPARWLVELYLETGRPKEAAAVADDFLRRRDMWEQSPRAEDFAMARDPSAVMLRALERAGALSREDFEARREAWLRAWEARAAPGTRGYLWIHNHAAAVETADDARVALAALPRYAPLPRFRPLTPADAWIGATYWLGGRRDEALPALRRAARSCLALDHPVAHTKAHLFLGQALEAEGDTAGACAAFAVVRDRWGRSNPRPAAAAAAEERLRALGCGSGR
jgi:serine/threonine-protein kinase